MKRILSSILLLLCVFAGDVQAQQITISGSGTLSSHLYNPLYTQSGGARSYRSAFIYSESLLAGMLTGSTINQLQFSRANAGPSLPAGNNLKLYLMNTTVNAWPAGALTWDISSAVLVYDGDPSAIVGTTAGYKAFPLVSTFTYAGNNLALFSEYSQVNAPATTINWHYNTPATQPAYQADQLKYTANSSTTMPATLNTTIGNHANMIIDYAPPPPCTAPPTAGAATASVSGIICSGTLVKLQLSGNSIGSGQTYQWQSFATAGGPYTNIGSASPSAKLDINPTATMFYRAAVTCGSSTVYSDSVEVKVAGIFPGGVYTINSAVATGGTNFQSLTDAVNAFRCGISGAVTFNVDAASGPYNEQIIIPQVGGASATNFIRFNGNGRRIFFDQHTTGARPVITLDGADYVTIDNLVIDGSGGTYGWGVQLLNNADNNTISNSAITTSSTSTVNANHTGIIIGGSSTSPTATGNAGNNNIITNNTVTGGYFGIVLSGNSTGAKSLNNTVSNNLVRDAYSHSINLSYQSGAGISENDISRPLRNGSATTSGVFLGTGNVSTVVERNRVHNMFDAMPNDASIFYGIHVGSDGLSGQENRIINNLVYNNKFNGTFYGIYNNGADYMLAYHNTIAAIDSATTTGATHGLFITGATTGVDFRNNILYINRSGVGIKRAIYFVTITSTIISNNNIIVFNDKAGGSDNHLGQWGTSLFITLADWKTANSNAYDQLSVDTDPVFSNPAGGDFTPREPIVDNLGAPVGVTNDIIRTARSTTAPDAGTYEFTPAPCTTPPTPGTPVASPAGIVCPTQNLILSLTGNSIGSGQTYQWQSSSTLNGTYSNITAVSDYHTSVINPTTTMFYRTAVTCGGNTVYSDTIEVVVASYFPAGTYTINSTLPTGGSNFQSFSDAVNAIRCGVTGGVTFDVDSAAGPYTEQITIPLIANATPANPIVFNGNGAIVQFNSFSEGRHIIKLDGAKHIIFNNLKVVGLNATYGWGFHLRRGADSNTISNCTIDMSLVTSTVQNNSAGIVASYASTNATAEGNNANYTTITGNTIIGAYTGIGMYGQANVLLNKRTTISNNTIRDFYATGILIMWNDSAVVINNNIHRANRTAVGTFTGIEVRAGCKNGLINANRIHTSHNAGAPQNGSAYGIFMNLCDAPDGQENRITNNLIYNLNSMAGLVYGLYNSTSDGVLYYHNTVVINNPSATAGVTHGFSEQSNLGRGAGINAHGHMTLRNNLFYISRGGSGEKVVLSFLTNPNDITSDRNNLYASVEGNHNIGKLGTTVYATLAGWKTAAGGKYDQQSVNINPAFVNLDSDFRSTASSMDNLGTFVGVTTDFFGAMRNTSTPDLGAIEFTITLPVTLSSFKGERQGAINKLEWTTLTEINNTGYELQRSADGRTFTKLAFVVTKADNGNSSTLLTYRFDDVTPLKGTGYYRLKQIDKDGKFTYSNIVVIRGERITVLTVGSVFPNPVATILNISIASPEQSKIVVMVTDVSGKVIMQKTTQIITGDNQLQLPVSHLSSGTYVIKLSKEDGSETAVQKFVKQ